ncbi:MASE1 domain-containing protein [Nocardioides sp. KIGAM211]|uniref:Sensor-like histidine kinase SenX3 n=1 Tax=Nocardioides luti TaxID=2761101 RepID=A0A7X0VC91_9ACTN|nr:ATP-binding protein [Nocardioides luti]MBB6629549.1 MASE1 domain-containing protein [Nocardioides luti]
MPQSDARPRAEQWQVLAAFVLLYVALGFAGRATLFDGTTFALVWPAGGAAVLWFLVRGAGARSLDTALLAGSVLGVNFVTGASLDVSLVLVVTNVLQTLVAVTLMRRWCPHLWGCGGRRPLDSPRSLARYIGAALLATGAAALLGTLAFGLINGRLDGLGGLLWFGRNLCSVLTLTTVGLLVGQRVTSPGPRAPIAASAAAGHLELLAAIVFTSGMYVLAFVFEDLPLAFPLLAATTWVGLRFATLLSALHATLIGAATVALTLRGIGPFADVPGAEVGALLAQFYVATIVVTALALSTGRDERQALAATLRRTQEQAVYEARLRDAIISSMDEALVVFDESGDLLVRNGAAAAILEPVGTGPASLYGIGATHPDGSPLLDDERPSYRALRGETVHDLEVLVEVPALGPRILAISASPLPPDAQTGRSRALMLCRDVTVERARREELASFAGVVAHDLRNPLAAIDGWTEMIGDELEAGELDPELAREFVSKVRDSSRRMRELIRDLLAHATSSARDLHVTRVDVAAEVAEVVAARHAEAAVTWGRIPPVAADPVLVRQVLDNLLGNALKYVDPDRAPRITVTAVVDDGGSDAVTIRVADNGVGMPAGEHDRIFEEFHRAHHRDFEGSGLGLSIVRRIVARHGGTIVARDNPEGRGTVFEFTLPRYLQADNVALPDPPASRSA